MGVLKVNNILPTPRNSSVHHHQLPFIYDSTWVNNNISAPCSCVDALAPRFQRKDAFTSCFKRNHDALSPLHSSIDKFTPRVKCINKPVPESLSVDALAPPYRSVDALAPPQCSVDISAPVQVSVDATAPGYFSVDAPCLAPFYSNVEALAPECSYPYSSVDAPSLDSTVPDYSVEVSVEAPAPLINCVEAYIMKLPSSELAPEKSSDAPKVLAKCPRQDNTVYSTMLSLIVSV